MHAHQVIAALAIVLGVAAVTTVLFRVLRQPVVLGYMLAGLVVGPYLPIPLVADAEIVSTLAELGVIVLMFSLGLEFSLRRLVQVAPTAGVVAVIQCSLMIWLGFVAGRAFGWTTLEAFVAGAFVAISSTTIIAKAFEEQRVAGPLRELVVAILIVEDLIAVLLLAALTAVGTGRGVSADALAEVVGQLALFLIAALAVGMLVIPRTFRWIVKLERAETTLVASLGVCFGGALLAHHLGYSVALGAFLAGSLIAESGEQHRIDGLVAPVRDMFAAVFFVSVGMMIDPAVVVAHLGPIAVLVVVVVIGKLVGVGLGAFLAGSGVRTSVQAGLSLAQIGEFSFIIAGLALSLGIARPFLYPIAVAVSALTTLSTPWLIRASGPVAAWVERKLPRPLQTFAALYGSWVERIRASHPRDTARARVRRLVVLLLLDGLCLAGVIIGAVVAGDVVEPWLLAIGAIAVGLPFAIAMVKLAGRIGVVIGEAVFSTVAKDRLDLAAAPRRALIVAVQLAAVLLIGLPVVALSQPFLPGVVAAIGFAVVLAALALLFWRSATNLQGHVRAASQVIVEALAGQGATPADASAKEVAEALVRGLGHPVPIVLDRGAPAIGHSLAQVEMRGLTGATVLAVARDGQTLMPDPHDPLREGDVLAVAGTGDAIAAARTLLVGPPP